MAVPIHRVEFKAHLYQLSNHIKLLLRPLTKNTIPMASEVLSQGYTYGKPEQNFESAGTNGESGSNGIASPSRAGHEKRLPSGALVSSAAVCVGWVSAANGGTHVL